MSEPKEQESGVSGEVPLPRFATGVPGLDRVLQGGLIQRGSYLIQGPAGTGKTILSNQIAFGHAAGGGSVAYIGLLTETTSQVLRYMREMAFFDRELVGTRLRYLGGQQALDQGIDQLLELARRTILAEGSTLLVLDGPSAVIERFDSWSLRRFLHELQAIAELAGCTVLLLLPTKLGQFRPEHAVVDGIVDLSYHSYGAHALRELTVQKLRGSDFLPGPHTFEITHAGIRVRPRTEALLTDPAPVPGNGRSIEPTGVPDLDEMIGGGLLSASSTVVLGPSGSGKTTLGLQFLGAGAARGESVLHFSFYESPDRILSKAESLGLPFAEYADRGLLRLRWFLPVNGVLDEAAEVLLGAVREHGVRRLFLDGLNALQQIAVIPERLPSFLAALSNELRALEVTTLISVESASLMSQSIGEPIQGLSALVENMVLLRYVEHRSEVRRLLSVLKLREGSYDARIRELNITSRGIELGGTFEGAEELLSGIAKRKHGEEPES